MVSLILIGLVGGVLTSLSPCIIPVLPLVLAVSAGDKRRPYYVVAGMVVSFATITLSGSIVLNLLGLPQDTVRWVGIGLLLLVGLGMLIPMLGEWVQAPFDRLPRLHALLDKAQGRGGFVVGLALGAVYVPCAGPVLAAITVAAATGEVNATIIALTIAFSVGAAIPLSLFALSGNRMSDWFRSHHTAFRRSAGTIVIAMALMLAVDAPATLQRLLPDWTSSAQQALGSRITQTSAVESCRTGDPGMPHACGPLPPLSGLENWVNTAQAIDPRTSGKVTLVDFWAYACINCQRANEHVIKLYEHYKDYGLDVIGVHAPEYAFERDVDNVRQAVITQHINYPVAQDNNFATWKNFHNRYWPAHYLADHTGQLRQVHEGEGKYAETEQVVRRLLQERDPNIVLPDPIEQDEHTNTEPRSPETYLGASRSQYQVSGTPKPGFYALHGEWDISPMDITPREEGAAVELNYRARWVQLVASGRGTVTVKRADGREQTFDITSDGTVDIIRKDTNDAELVTITPSKGVHLYSVTFG